MSEDHYFKYLNDDNSLNTAKLWSDVAEITGFYGEGRRKDLYDAVTTWYHEYVRSQKEKTHATP